MHILILYSVCTSYMDKISDTNFSMRRDTKTLCRFNKKKSASDRVEKKKNEINSSNLNNVLGIGSTGSIRRIYFNGSSATSSTVSSYFER